MPAAIAPGSSADIDEARAAFEREGALAIEHDPERVPEGERAAAIHHSACVPRNLMLLLAAPRRGEARARRRVRRALSALFDGMRLGGHKEDFRLGDGGNLHTEH